LIKVGKSLSLPARISKLILLNGGAVPPSKALFAACRKHLKPSNLLPLYAPDDHSKIRKAILKFSQEVKISK